MAKQAETSRSKVGAAVGTSGGLDMSNRHNPILTRAVGICAVALAVAGCPKDPNQNSMTIEDAAVLSGTGGAGTSGTGGSSVATRPIVGSPAATFDTTTEGFTIDNFADTAQVNLGASGAAAMPPTLAFDSSDGSPTAGSLIVTAPYSGPSQYVSIQKNVMAMPPNWMGETMHVRIKVTSGTFKGGVQLYVKTGAAYVFGGTYINFGAGSNWQEFTLPVNSPMTMNAGYDPTHVFSFGLLLNTGSAGAGSTPVTFNIDSFSIDPPLAGGSTGTGGNGSGGATGGAAGASAGAGGAAAAGAGGAAGGGAAAGAGGGSAGGAAGGTPDAGSGTDATTD